MKSKFVKFATPLMLICLMFVFVACDLKVEPYIKVEGLKTDYNVGDRLYVGTAMIHYYEDEGTKFYTEIELHSSMISGFSTEEAGEFEMTISYRNLSTKVKYTVGEGDGNQNQNQGANAITQQEAENILFEAIANMCTFTEIKETLVSEMLGIEIETYKIITKDKLYSY